MSEGRYTVRRAAKPTHSSTFGTFAWEVLRPDGTVVVLTNSRTEAHKDADRLNTVGHL